MTGLATHESSKDAGKDPNRASPAGERDGLSVPAGFKPWEDKSLPPSDRLEAYKGFVRSQVEATLAAVDALTGDARRQLEIRDAPETQRIILEAKWVQGVTAEEFCYRLDRTPLQVAQEMVDSYSFNTTTGVFTFTVPADVTDVEAMKALNEYFRKHHGRFDRDAVHGEDLKGYGKLHRKFPEHCQVRDYSQAREVSIIAVDEGTTKKDRATQERILKNESLIFADPRDQALAASLHACKHEGEDLFKGLWVRGSVPGSAVYTRGLLGVYGNEYVGAGGYDHGAASGSPSPELK